jgi:transposase
MRRPIFKQYNQGLDCLFPMRLDEKIPADSPARLVSQIVDKLDISRVIDTYKGGGTTSYHPRMMLKVLLYAYLNNIYSCRKIAKNIRENIHYMWLSGMQEPDFHTVNTFRSSHLKDTINQIFTQVVLLPVDMRYLTLNTIYMDGTKMESRANRYSFVWRKSVEKNRAKLEVKIEVILKQIDECIAQDDDPPTPINSKGYC